MSESPHDLVLACRRDLRRAAKGLREARARLSRLTALVEPAALALLATRVLPLHNGAEIFATYPWLREPEVRAQRLRQAREQAGLTRLQLATLCGVADSTVRNVEMQKYRPTTATLRRIMRVLVDLRVDPTSDTAPIDQSVPILSPTSNPASDCRGKNRSKS